VSKKNMKWEVRKIDEQKWGVFLMQEFCKTDEPVCYSASTCEKTAQKAVDRMNNPSYWIDDEDE